jgi:hypothetical protein
MIGPVSATSSARRLLAALACAALVFASGCDRYWIYIDVVILDFNSSAVEGVGIWGESAQRGRWELVGNVAFEHSITPSGIEVVNYQLHVPGSPPVPLSSEILRRAAYPDLVRLELLYAPVGAGPFRVSAYNRAGHSPLSPDAIEF